MKYRTLLLTLATVFLLAACAKDDWTNNGWNNNGGGGSDVPGGNSGSSGELMSFDELSNFAVEINTATLSEQENIPTDKTDALYNNYVENNFSAQITTSIVFNGTDDAKVTGIADGDTVTVNKGAVEVRTHSKGLTLCVSGSTSNGSLKIYSEKKFRLELKDASITNADGAAINIQKGNCFLVLSGTNTLADGAEATYSKPENEDMKAVLFAEDDLRISGSGLLSVTANNKVGKAAITSDDAVFIRPNTNIQISSKESAGNGIKANERLIVKGGVLNIETAGAGSKGLSADGNMTIDGGRITIITTGGVDTSVANDPSGCAAIKCDSTLQVNGGELRLKSTGQGGKGISSDLAVNIGGGKVFIITQGSQYGTSSGGGMGPGGGPGGMGGWGQSSSSNSVSPKGIRCDGDITISGGDIFVRTGGSNAEGIESKATLTFSGGNTAALAYDDGFNAKTINISGGKALAISSGNCDGMDSNGAISATGGVLIGVASTMGSEDGIDCESTLTISNATVIGLSSGGLGIRISGSYISTTVSGNANDYVSLCSGSDPLVTFKLPRTYNSGRLILSAPSLKSGSYDLYTGTTPTGGTLWMNFLEGCKSVTNGSCTAVQSR